MMELRPRGTWTADLELRSFEHLQPGASYVVTQQFTDYDGVRHLVGERWTFLTSNFLPYEDGLSLFVAPNEAHECHIRLQWRAESQGEIIDRLGDYLAHDNA